MGALCSGKSDNPAHLEPNRGSNRAGNNGAIGVPKVTYSNNAVGLLENTSPETRAELKSKNGKLELDVNKAENIKVEQYLA